MFDIAILLARLLLGVPFILWGIMKLRGGEAKLVPVLASMGLPDAKGLAYMVGVCELVGGIGVVIGWPLALFSVLLGIWCIITALVAHKNDVNQLLSHTGMAGGFVALAGAGPGALALF